ncbi:MAG: lamin tail domain-containing protein [Planctomycetes bacterium]|nr:lamin tail domain-containing protein [Planctomycetota bacterium]
MLLPRRTIARRNFRGAWKRLRRAVSCRLGSENVRAHHRLGSHTVEALEPRLVLDSTVVFNEIMYHPAEDDVAGEWIELHNQMAVDMDLSGWRVSGGVKYEFAQGTVLGGGEYLVVAADPDALREHFSDLENVFGPFDGNLSNGGERLRLRSNNDRTMDEVDYGDGGRWPVAPDGSGVTLAKSDPDTGSAQAENWTFSEQIGGTPGALNFIGSLPPAPPKSTNLLGFYQFEGDYLDSSESAHHGAVTGSVPFNNSGFEGQAVSFSNNIANYIQVEIDASPQNNATLTWGAWVKSAQPGGDINTILSNDNGGWDRFLFHDAGRWAVSSGFGIQRSSVATSSEWTFVAATFDGNSQRLFVDSDTPVMSTRDPSGPSQTFVHIGRNANGCGSCAWSGLIDNVFIFDDVLSDAEIAGIRAGGAAAILALEKSNDDGGNNTAPVDLPSLAINEVASSLDATFRVEIVNTGDEPVALDGIVLASSDADMTDFVFGDQMLASGGFMVLNATQLGFGAEDGDRLFLYGADKTGVIDAAVVKDRLRGRSAQHDGRWLWPSEATFGAANQFAFHDEIVINEIFYHGYPQRAEGDVPFAKSEEEWIELYNRSDSDVDLSGWRLDDAVGFVFPPNTTLAAGEYLVVAKDAVALRAKHPGIDIVGDFSRRLSNRSDRIELRDPANNPADVVEYYDDGRWPEFADGGGSSLELRDPNADNSRAGAWSASDEGRRSSWQTYTYRGVATNDGIGLEIWNEFVLGLLTAGEVLLDNISVIESPSGAAIQLIQNGSFQSDAIGAAPAKWRAIGNHGSHGRTVVEADPLDPNNRVLHVVATGPTEHMHNQVTTTFVGNRRVQAGREYEISFDAKWLGSLIPGSISTGCNAPRCSTCRPAEARRASGIRRSRPTPRRLTTIFDTSRLCPRPALRSPCRSRPTIPMAWRR